MRKTREILRQTWGLNMSKRQVARSLSVSHSTVIGCLRRADQAGLNWPLPEELDDTALESLLYPPTERPVFEELVKYVCATRTIKHVVFVWVSRMARNFEDYTDFKKRLRVANPEVHLHFIKDDLVFQPLNKEDYKEESDLEDILRQSKKDSGETSEIVIDARSDRFKEGRVTYDMAYGYDNKINPDTRRKYVAIIKEEPDRVSEIFKLMATGKYTVATLANELINRGWKKPSRNRKLKIITESGFSHNYLNYMLRNETYLGKVKWRGEAKFTSEVPAIIDQALFDRVQKVLKSRSRYTGDRPEGKYQSPIAKICKCHFCGCQITTDLTVKKDKEYIYIRCTNGKRHRSHEWYKKRFGKPGCVQPYNTETEVIKAIDTEVYKLWMDENIFAWMRSTLEHAFSASHSLKEETLRILRQKLTKLNKRKNELNIMRADYELTKEEFAEAKTETLQDIEAIEQQLVALDAEVNFDDQLEISLGILDNLKSRWQEFTRAEKTDVLRIMTKKIILGEHGKNKPEITWEKPWDMLIEIGNKTGTGYFPIEINWYARTDSNCRPSDS